MTDYQGRYYRCDGAETIPQPVQQPRPPITVAAHGPRMLRIAAQYADGWSSWGGYDVQTEDDFYAITAERARRFDDLCAHFGRDPTAIRHSVVCFPPLTPWESVGYFTDMVGRLRERRHRRVCAVLAADLARTAPGRGGLRGSHTRCYPGDAREQSSSASELNIPSLRDRRAPHRRPSPRALEHPTKTAVKHFAACECDRPGKEYGAAGRAGGIEPTDFEQKVSARSKRLPTRVSDIEPRFGRELRFCPPYHVQGHSHLRESHRSC